jgi:hypothetical protein
MQMRCVVAVSQSMNYSADTINRLLIPSLFEPSLRDNKAYIGVVSIIQCTSLRATLVSLAERLERHADMATAIAAGHHKPHSCSLTDSKLMRHT